MRPGEPDAGRPTGFRGRRPVFWFVLVFGLCMGVYYAITTTSLFEETVFPAYLRYNAVASTAILNTFGADATTSGITILSPRSSLQIKRGCDAVAPSALFVSAVLAAPTLVRRKLLGIVAGSLALMVINLMRIVTLFYTRIYYPDAFEIMHIEVWQALFIFLALLFWVIWARWAVRGGVLRADVAT